MKLSSLFDKTGSIGVFVSALGCAGCFPALGSLAAALGMGAISNYEGVLINKLLPLFAVIALLANLVGWYQHRVLYRGLLSVVGPAAVLTARYPFWNYAWGIYVFYIGLITMLTVSILDLFRPAKARQCIA